MNNGMVGPAAPGVPAEGGALGYNIGEVESLLSQIAGSYNSLGEKMASGWSELSASMEKEWVGPDELSYETQLAADICSLYASCSETVTAVMKYVAQLANDWREFQKGNLLQIEQGNSRNPEHVAVALVGADGDAFKEITIPTLTKYEISTTVKPGNPTFTKETLMGLTNGLSSADNIRNSFDAYISGVYEGVNSLYNDVSETIGKAFVGGTSKTSLETYLQSVYTGIAKLSTSHKAIYEALDGLVKQYTTQDTNLNTGINTSKENLENVDFSASLGGTVGTTPGATAGATSTTTTTN